MIELSFAFILGLMMVGFLVGTISPTFGIGGGFLTVPILIMFYNFESDIATATSLGLIIFTTLSGTIGYIREKRVDFKLASVFMLFTIPGSILGSLLSLWLKTQNFNLDILQIIFAVFLLMVAGFRLVSFFLKSTNKNIENIEELKSVANDCLDIEDTSPWWKTNFIHRDFLDRSNIRFTYNAKLFPQVIIATIGGFMGALLGIGGGVVYVSILTIFMGVPIGIATATSTFTMFISNFFPVFLRFSSIEWQYVLYLSIGTVISASLVPRFISKVKSNLILKGFWAFVMITALRMILNVLGFVV